jgi:hypothetical protein
MSCKPDKIEQTHCRLSNKLLFEKMIYKLRNVIRLYEGYSGSNLRSAANKTSNKEKLLYTEIRTYLLKRLLNVFTAGIQALLSENKLLYACATF